MTHSTFSQALFPSASGLMLALSFLVPGEAIALESTVPDKANQATEPKQIVLTDAPIQAVPAMSISELTVAQDSPQNDIQNADRFTQTGDFEISSGAIALTPLGTSITLAQVTDSSEDISEVPSEIPEDTSEKFEDTSTEVFVTETEETSKAAIGAIAQAVTEEASEPDSEERDWQFELTPFAFLPLNVSGTSTVEGVTSDINMDLGEVLDVLTFAASGRFEAWYRNRIGIVFEGYYSELGDNGEDVISGPRGLVTLTTEVDVRFEQAYFDLGMAYRMELDDGNDDDATTRAGIPDGYFDVIVGLRLQYLRQTADLTLDLSGPNQNRRFDAELGTDETWLEPLLSTRLGLQIAPDWGIGARFDISGFNFDGMSLSWRFLGGVDWRFAGDTSLRLGYSIISIDYTTGDGDDEFGLDQIQHGPYLGMTFRF
jgi:hypothetical protein